MKASGVVLTAVSSLLLTACGGDSSSFAVGGGGGTGPTESISLECSIPTSEIFAAATRDAIPSLTNPELAGSTAVLMTANDRVLGVVVNGEARA